MITKILFTLAVIALVILVVRFRQRQPAPEVRNTGRGRSRLLLKTVTFAVIILMLVSVSVVIYLEWQANRELLVVQVIDSRTGKTTEYQVYRNKLDERGFQSVDGRYVRLAETDRLEIAPER